MILITISYHDGKYYVIATDPDGWTPQLKLDLKRLFVGVFSEYDEGTFGRAFSSKSYLTRELANYDAIRLMQACRGLTEKTVVIRQKPGDKRANNS